MMQCNKPNLFMTGLTSLNMKQRFIETKNTYIDIKQKMKKKKNNKVINQKNTKWGNYSCNTILICCNSYLKIMTRIQISFEFFDSVTFHHLWVRMVVFISTNVNLEMCYNPIIYTLCQTLTEKLPNNLLTKWAEIWMKNEQ